MKRVAWSRMSNIFFACTRSFVICSAKGKDRVVACLGKREVSERHSTNRLANMQFVICQDDHTIITYSPYPYMPTCRANDLLSSIRPPPQRGAAGIALSLEFLLQSLKSHFSECEHSNLLPTVTINLKNELVSFCRSGRP